MLLHYQTLSPKRLWVFVAISFALVLLITAHQKQLIPGPDLASVWKPFRHLSPSLLEQQGEFWRCFHQDLLAATPEVGPIEMGKPTFPLDRDFNATDETRTRPALVRMSDYQIEGMAKAHSDFVKSIKARKYALPYNKGTRGIVTTAGGKYMMMALLSIRMHRFAGSKLPVEVFLADRSEYDEEICDTIFPALDAKCVLLSDIFQFDEMTNSTTVSKYQYKIMAILFSSFEDVMFLDADAFSIYPPNALFDSPPYTDSGLVLWPDFWYNTESPLYYEIAGVEEPDIHRRASTESGEILVSKRKHEQTLFLSAYYNYYGPRYYYRLQSQGAAGEGDKTTFITAAEALGASFYDVKKPVRVLGFHAQNGVWRGSGMAQFDPMQDYLLQKEDPSHPTSPATSSAAATGPGPFNASHRRPYFCHVNHHKPDPFTIFERHAGQRPVMMDSDDNWRRVWHNSAAEAVDFFGYDVEKPMWALIRELACKDDSFERWRDGMVACGNATEYYEAVYGEG